MSISHISFFALMVLASSPAEGLIAPAAAAARNIEVGVMDDVADLSTLDAILALALERNHGLASLGESWRSAAAAAEAASTLPAPRVNFAWLMEPVETRVGPQRWRAGISQSIPWPGKLSLRGDIAAEETLLRESRYSARAAELVLDVTRSVIDLAWLDASLERVLAGRALLAAMEELSLSDYRNGKGEFAQLLRLRNRLAILDERAAGLRDRRASHVAAVNALLGRASEAPLPRGIELPPLGDLPAAETAQALLPANSPLLAGRDAAVSKSRRARDLAAKNGLPDFTLGLEYIATDEARMDGVPDSGKDPLVAKLSFTLPIWRGEYRAAEASAAADLRAAEAARDDLEQDLRARLQRAYWAHREARRVRALHEDVLIPSTRLIQEAEESAYRAGEASLNELLELHELLLGYELDVLRAGFDQLLSQAEVEFLIAAYPKEKNE